MRPGVTPPLIVAVTIRADRYEPLQTAPELAGVHSAVFDELKPMPPAGYEDVITGPARRATAAGRRLTRRTRAGGAAAGRVRRRGRCAAAAGVDAGAAISRLRGRR